MAINYAEKYSKTIDERFTQASITERAINKDFDFVGVQTVKVYSVPTVAMGDYKRQGAQRYGVPEELKQECRQRLTPELAEILCELENALSESAPKT